MFKDGDTVGNFSSCDSLALHKWMPIKKSILFYLRTEEREIEVWNVYIYACSVLYKTIWKACHF